MSHRILCVDDDAHILAGFQRSLRKQFALDTALGPEQGLRALEHHGPYAVVVADMQMPGLNGVQFLKKVEEKSPDTVRIMLTGNADQKTAMEAVNDGHVFRFLTKPCPPDLLALALQAGLKQYRLITAERELLETTLNGTITVLMEILSMLDPVSFGLGQKLREYMRAYAQHVKIAPSWDLELCAMLSQIGYVTIPAAVIQKARAEFGLSAEEHDMVAGVPRTGADLLSRIPRLEQVSRNVLYQAKHFDGSGFPAEALAGEEIPLGARILKVLSDLVALERRGHSRFKALVELRARKGWYDPRVLDSVFACFDVCLAGSESVQAETRQVEWKHLQTGQVLISKIETLDGILIAGAGTPVTPMLLEKVRNFSALNGIKEPIQVTA
jgi:response regulator RpfG family c-di-GMP phosphodiesterase